MKKLNAAEVQNLEVPPKKRAQLLERKAKVLDVLTDLSRLTDGHTVGRLIHDTAAHMLQCQGAKERPLLDSAALTTLPSPAHSLIGPNQYSDDQLREYLLKLAPYSVGHPDSCHVRPPSPLIAGQLLGGILLPEVERQCYRALSILEAYPPDLVPTLSEAVNLTGFGRGVPHNEPPVEIIDPRQSVPVNYLRSLPRLYPFAFYLLERGAVGGQLAHRIERHRPKVIRMVTEWLTPGAKQSITGFMADQLSIPPMTDAIFYRGVRRLYEREWAELELYATPDRLAEDMEVMAARALLHCLGSGNGRTLSKLPKLNRYHIVGLAMLTGITVAKWVEFAVIELRRCGETFIEAAEVDGVIDVIESTELGTWFQCLDALSGYRAELEFADRTAQKRGQRMRKSSWPLWTTKATSYYALTEDEDGDRTYSHDPESLE